MILFIDQERLCGCTSGGSSGCTCNCRWLPGHTWPCKPSQRYLKAQISTTIAALLVSLKRHHRTKSRYPFPDGPEGTAALPGCRPVGQRSLGLGRPGDSVCYGLGVVRCHARRRHGAGAGQRAFRLAGIHWAILGIRPKVQSPSCPRHRGPFRTHISRHSCYNNRTEAPDPARRPPRAASSGGVPAAWLPELVP